MAVLLSGCQSRQGAEPQIEDSAGGGQKERRELVYLNHHASLRLKNDTVKIRVDSAGDLSVSTATRGKENSRVRRVLTKAELNRLKAELEAVDWISAAKDDVFGLDGSTVYLKFDGKELKLWTPDADARERGLVEVQQVIATLFEYAGIGANRQPKRQ